eukprot:scaffold36680_cov69-Phaeocystis_antarctica.AAC.2
MREFCRLSTVTGQPPLSSATSHPHGFIRAHGFIRGVAFGCLRLLGNVSHRIGLGQQPPLAADCTSGLLADDVMHHGHHLALEGGAAAIGELVDHADDGVLVLAAEALGLVDAEVAREVEDVLLDGERSDRPVDGVAQRARAVDDEELPQAPEPRQVGRSDEQHHHVGRGDVHGQVAQRLADLVLVNAVFVDPERRLEAVLLLEAVCDELDGAVLVVGVVPPRVRRSAWIGRPRCAPRPGERRSGRAKRGARRGNAPSRRGPPARACRAISLPEGSPRAVSRGHRSRAATPTPRTWSPRHAGRARTASGWSRGDTSSSRAASSRTQRSPARAQPPSSPACPAR